MVYLATRGMQDYFLTEKPDFTFFSTVYTKDIAHVTTTREIPFDSGSGTIATLPTNGDYISEITLKVTLDPTLQTYENLWKFQGDIPLGNVTFYSADLATLLYRIDYSDYIQFIDNGSFNFRGIIGSLTSYVIVFDNINIANYYGYDAGLVQLLGGYYSYTDPNPSSSPKFGISPLTLIECGWVNKITESTFYIPQDLAIDSSGNIYVVDTGNSVIRMIGPGPTYTVTTIAGTSGQTGTLNGPGSVALFNSPQGITIDTNGNIYVADSGNHTIRIIGPGPTYTVTTIAGTPGVYGCVNGPGSTAQFWSPAAMDFDSVGNLYVADTGNSVIRMIGPGPTYNVTTIAGTPGVFGWADGPGSTAQFYRPADVKFDSSGNMYVADTFTSTIRKIGPGPTYNVTTIAGVPGTIGNTDGFGSVALFNLPYGISLALDGTIYVADAGNCTIRTIGSSPSYSVTTLAGIPKRFGSIDGPITKALFTLPYAVRFDPNSGNIIVVDTGGSSIRLITSSQVSTFAGSTIHNSFKDGPALSSAFDYPVGITCDTTGNLYIADTNNSVIRKIDTSQNVTTIAGYHGINGYRNGNGTLALFNAPYSIVFDVVSGNLYVSDTGNSVIRAIGPGPTYTVSTVAGVPGTAGLLNGAAASALFDFPIGITCDTLGNIFVSDSNNSVVRKISAGVVTTEVSGLNSPCGLTYDGSLLYITDSYGATISVWDGVSLSTLTFSFGGGFGPSNISDFVSPTDVKIDAVNDYIYICDVALSCIFIGSLISYTIVAVLGTPAELGLSQTLLTAPFACTLNSTGTLYFTDSGNSRILSYGDTIYVYAGTTPTLNALNPITNYPDDTMYYYINSISLSIGKQVIQQLPSGYLKIKKDISNTYKNRPVLKLLEGDTNISAQSRVYYLKTGLLKNIPIHLLENQDMQVIVDTKIQKKSLLVDYVVFTGTTLPNEYTLVVPQAQVIDQRNNWNIKGPTTKLIADEPFEFSINGEKLFDSDTSNVAQIENLVNVSSTGYINVFKGPMNMSRIRDKYVDISTNSNVWAETLNVLHIKHGLAGLAFESSFYNFNAPSSYLIS